MKIVTNQCCRFTHFNYWNKSVLGILATVVSFMCFAGSTKSDLTRPATQIQPHTNQNTPIKNKEASELHMQNSEATSQSKSVLSTEEKRQLRQNIQEAGRTLYHP